MKPIRTYSFIAALILASSVFAQAPQVFKTKMGIVPLANPAARATIDESSTVFAAANITATLNGSKLTVTGSFEGFKNPASIAQIHTGMTTGVRGPVVFDLTVTKATKGTVTGTFDLNANQLTLLKDGRLYVQIHNTETPEGALWGWLLK